jgi:hypothetical protein
MALTLIFGILGGSFVPGQRLARCSRWRAASHPTVGRWTASSPWPRATGLAVYRTHVIALLVMAAVLFAVSALLFRRRQSELL